MGIEDGGLGRLFSLLSPLPFLLFYRKAVPCDLLTDCERGTRIGDGGRGDSLPSSSLAIGCGVLKQCFMRKPRETSRNQEIIKEKKRKN